MNVQSGLAFVKAILGRGRFSFTHDEVAQALNRRGQALNMTLQRLKRDGWIVPFSRGFYVALDVQHQSAAMLDPRWFVDDWARFLGAAYYMGGLSAAALHGAAHQRPVVFQVFMNRAIRPVTCRHLRVEVFFKQAIPEALVDRHKTPAGYFRASSPELTAYDILANRRCCPSLSHAATVYVELGEAIHPARLASLTRNGGRIAVLQRAGWLLDHAGWAEKTARLHADITRRRLAWRPLDGRMPLEGSRDERWRVLVNADVQPDIRR